jgi:hypothetical protein
MRRPTSTPGKLRSKLRELVRSESGIALPTVMTVTVIALGLGGAAALASISAQQGSVRDYDSKTAIAAADAGAERALYRYNQVLTTEEATCLVLSGGVLVESAPPPSGWCPEVSGTIDDSTYVYRVRPLQVGSRNQLEIVSTGTTDGITRRIEVTATSTTGRVFGEYSVIGNDQVTVDSNSTINGNTASNGDIALESNSQICGNVQVGPGDDFEGEICAGYGQGEGTIYLPLVDQGDVATNNSNARFFAPNGDPPPGDVRQGRKDRCAPGDPLAPDVCYDAATRTLIVGSNTSLTIGGENYSLCTLVLESNSDLIIADGAKARFYFDSPENCGLPDGAVQMQLNSNSRINTTSNIPSDAAFLFVGSNALDTWINLDSNTGVCSEFIVYAPLTFIDLDSNSRYCGAVAGKDVHLDSFVTVDSDPSNAGFEIPIPLHFERSRYVECTGPDNADSPDSGC